MKKVCLPLALSAMALAVSPVQASDLTVYGKVNLSLNQMEQESKGVDEWQLNSNASRLGVKGSYDLEDGLTAIYKMEFEVSVDDGDKKGQVFAQRNIYAGLKGEFGTVIAGMNDTPLKKAQGKIDRFSDITLGDIKNIMEGEDRVKNIVMYTTPKMSGFSATVAAILSEDSADADTSNGSSISLNFKNDLVTAALARNGDVDGQDTIRLVTDFNLGDTKLGVMWQTAEDADDSSVDEDSWMVSAQHKIGSYAVKAQYGMTDYSNDNEDTLMVLGVDKKLSKKSKIYTYYAAVQKESGATKADDKTFGFGYEIKF